MLALLAILAGTNATGVVCPSTPVAVACGMKVTATASASCDEVKEEMKARVSGQGSVWHDPHNRGTYTEQSYGGSFSASRLTGDGTNYTDKMIFSLTSEGDSCKLEGCSRSQVFSIKDMGTNYCNLKMLFCGSEDGCKPVLHDFTVSGEVKQKFSQSSADLSACLTA
mmetsp:Transcript_11364/g.25457  ORF Transcript_11364/g.25457 Transcript_11364/m.25457 type:complete len:167 (-) Transcript_11364:44-544(-)